MIFFVWLPCFISYISLLKSIRSKGLLPSVISFGYISCSHDLSSISVALFSLCFNKLVSYISYIALIVSFSSWISCLASIIMLFTLLLNFLVMASVDSLTLVSTRSLIAYFYPVFSLSLLNRRCLLSKPMPSISFWVSDCLMCSCFFFSLLICCCWEYLFSIRNAYEFSSSVATLSMQPNSYWYTGMSCLCEGFVLSSSRICLANFWLSSPLIFICFKSSSWSCCECVEFFWFVTFDDDELLWCR